MNRKTRNIGLDVKQPESACNDKHCPFHGDVKVRGRLFSGTVIKNVMHKTTAITLQRLHYLPKYERYEKRRTKINVHIPECFTVKKGDNITIMETRPISKTKNFVVIEISKK